MTFDGLMFVCLLVSSFFEKRGSKRRGSERTKHYIRVKGLKFLQGDITRYLLIDTNDVH